MVKGSVKIGNKIIERTKMNYFLNVAPQDSWVESIRLGICGVPPAEINRQQWKKVEEKDILLFYATAPISGIIGLAKVVETFEERIPLWPQEISSGRVFWPYRIRLTEVQSLPKERWLKDRIKLSPKISVQRSLRALADFHAIDIVKQVNNIMELG